MRAPSPADSSPASAFPCDDPSVAPPRLGAHLPRHLVWLAEAIGARREKKGSTRGTNSCSGCVPWGDWPTGSDRPTPWASDGGGPPLPAGDTESNTAFRPRPTFGSRLLSNLIDPNGHVIDNEGRIALLTAQERGTLLLPPSAASGRPRPAIPRPASSPRWGPDSGNTGCASRTATASPTEEPHLQGYDRLSGGIGPRAPRRFRIPFPWTGPIPTRD